MSRKRSLKVWNGLIATTVAGKFKQCTANVCAYNQKDAIELLASFDNYSISLYEFRMMWSDCWGTSMNDIVPERGIWVEYQTNKPERVI
jgi:hypothetical protein